MMEVGKERRNVSRGGGVQAAVQVCKGPRDRLGWGVGGSTGEGSCGQPILIAESVSF